ncbi:MAG: FHA domain-containing protein, partial [Lachnospiraceae bacterium]|nr:FHA domain-containing protein [Lachnospiraceae bacterium]
MIITTITTERIRTVSLPEKVAGQYWLYEDTEKGTGRLVSVEGIDTTWYMKSNRDIHVLGENGKTVKSVPLSPMQTYALQKKNGEIIVVYTEPATDDRQIFHRFSVQDGIEIRIGRSMDCDIIYDRPIVTSTHAVLTYVNSVWQIRDDNSKNGTYVNGMRCRAASLKPGDCIYIMGLRIIVGKKLIAFNNPDCFVRISDKLKTFVPQQVILPAEDEEYELNEESYFYRSPRFKRDVETAEIKIDSPPTSPIGEEMPIVLVLGSSMAMGMMSLVTLTTAIINGNVTSMVMGGSMMIGTLLLPMITKRYERNRRRKKENQRQRRYREYLQRISAEIMETGELQESILKENIITTAECETRIINRTRTLWDRAMGQNDYLVLRLGSGDAMLDAEISYQERRFTIEDDYLQDELYSLCEKPKLLHNVPISYSLFENPISGVVGDRKRVVSFAQGLLIQLVTFYSYDELKLVFLVDPEEEQDFEFVKWLPHVWNDEKTFRFIATNETEVKEVSAYLESIVDVRREMNEKDMEEEKPYYIIFSMSSRLSARAEMLKEILAHRENMHISVVAFTEDLQHLPRECSMVIDLSQGKGRLYDKDDTSGKSIDFTPDIYPTRNPLELGRLLANTSLDTVTGSFSLPKTITFLELFGVGKAEHLNALTRWKENDPTKSLQAAVGVDTLGGQFYLDLHEKFHGPHGLVAGMTGSGKSEFIITYILSLAINYHPNEVAFILIDYKGGGMAKSFEHLPHTAGIITNLDGAAIKRSLVSIESELKRRQAIFAAAGKKVGVSNIDIYKYQKLYREGRVDEPLQHL